MIKTAVAVTIFASLLLVGCGTSQVEPDLNKTVKVTDENRTVKVVDENKTVKQVDQNKTEKVVSRSDCNCTNITNITYVTNTNTVASPNKQQVTQKQMKPYNPADDDCTSGLIYNRQYKTILAE